MSLRARLILLVLVPSIPLFAMTFLLTDRVREMLIGHSSAEMRALATLASNELRTAVEVGEHLVASIAQIPGIAEGDLPTCRRVFNGVLGSVRHFASFAMLDEAGNVRCHSSVLLESYNVAERDYFQRARDSGRFAIGRPVVGRITGRPLLPLAYPLKDANGRFHGIMFGGLDLRWLGDRFASVGGSGEYTFTIWGEDGTILYRFPDPDRWVGKRLESVGISRAVLGRTERSVLVEAASVDGRPSLYAIVGNEDWSGSRMAFSVGIDQDRLSAAANRYFQRGVLVLLAVFATALAAALLLAESGIRRRAVALEAAAGRIASGYLEARSGLRSRTDELGRLADSFDRMAGKLQRETRYLKMLSEAGKAVVRAKSEPSLLEELCRVMLEHGNYRSSWVGYVRHDEAKSIKPMAQAGMSMEFLESLPLTWQERGLGLGAAGTAIRTREPAVATDIVANHVDASWAEYVRGQGWAAHAAFPLLIEGEVAGVMVVSATEAERFAPADVELLSQLAAELAFGIGALRDRLALERHAVELESLVASRTADLSSANHFLDSVIENIPDMIFVKDAADLRFVRLNRAAEALLGYSRDELVGKNDHDFFPRDEADAFVAADRQVLEGAKVLEIEEEPVDTRHQGTRLLHTKKFTVFDNAGRPRYLVGISQDITERKAREREIRALYVALEQHAAQLQAANRELEAFSYSVSHDLRAPLHAVSGFAQALSEEFVDRLDERGRHLLERIRAGAARMDGLINDLLSLSRISRVELVAGKVDWSALAAEVMADIREGEPSRKCRITIRPGMRVKGDANLLRVALTNLLGNAWKFSRGREETVIEVGEISGDGQLQELFVRDNGAGFDPAHASRLFGAFQRLHSQSEFPGTGIGLAIVRRVIERHGGHIRAESSPGSGATFFFSLPKVTDAVDQGRRTADTP